MWRIGRSTLARLTKVNKRLIGSELIRDDEKRKAGYRLEVLLLEGLESEENELTRQDFADIRNEALAQLNAATGVP